MSARARPGLSLLSLAVITVVTVSWWALALLPVEGSAPEWVLRTRLACFGAEPGGLPNAGGWVLLVGEPVGFLAVLITVWGDSLARDLRLAWSSTAGKLAMSGATLGLAWGVAWSASRVSTALAADAAPSGLPYGVATRAGTPAPPLHLVDQHGAPFDLRSLRGRPVVVTFAYAHCQTVCPTIVQAVRRARQVAERADVPIVVVTLDPWRDVVARLPAIASGWGLDGDDRVLSGDVSDVNRALDAWGVTRARDGQTGELDHVSLVLLVDREAKVAWRFSGSLDKLAAVLPLA